MTDNHEVASQPFWLTPEQIVEDYLGDQLRLPEGCNFEQLRLIVATARGYGSTADRLLVSSNTWAGLRSDYEFIRILQGLLTRDQANNPYCLGNVLGYPVYLDILSD